LKTGMSDQHNMAEAQRVLAQQIMCSAAEGQRDPWLLARDALFHLWQVRYTGESLPPAETAGLRAGCFERGVRGPMTPG
jgi:hypothetical protein